MTKLDTHAMLRRVTADLMTETDQERRRRLQILNAKLESHHQMLERFARPGRRTADH